MLHTAVKRAVFKPYMNAVAGCDSLGVSEDRAGCVGRHGKAAREHPERAHRLKRRYEPDIFLPFGEQEMLFRRVQTVGKAIHIQPPVLKKARRALQHRTCRKLVQPRGESIQPLPLRLTEPVFQREEKRADVGLLRYGDLRTV